MSFVELKKINSDNKKSLDVLMKEQFSSNNSNVNNIKNDINYIKSTQLGTNIDVFLNNLTFNSNFKNMPLVNKINAILIMSGKISNSVKYISGNALNLLSSGSGFMDTVKTYSVKTDFNGNIKLTANLNGNSQTLKMKDSSGEYRYIINTGYAGGYGTKIYTISVVAGETYIIEKSEGIDALQFTADLIFSN